MSFSGKMRKTQENERKLQINDVLVDEIQCFLNNGCLNLNSKKKEKNIEIIKKKKKWSYIVFFLIFLALLCLIWLLILKKTGKMAKIANKINNINQIF